MKAALSEDLEAEASGFRSLIATREDRDSRHIIAITVHHAENIALDGEAPDYLSLPGQRCSNLDLARVLIDVAAKLMESPASTALPVPDRALCAE